MLSADVSVCPRKTYRASSVAFAFFIAVSGLAGMKLVIGAPLHWFLALTAFTAWAALRPEPLVRTTLSVFTELLSLKPGWLFFWGAWLCFCLGILVAGAANGWVGVYTVPKYLVLMGVLWLLVAFVPTNGEVVRGLYLLALVGLLGLVIIWFSGYREWLVFPPKRFGWEFLPPGVIWKTGVFLLPPLCWLLVNQRSPSVFHWMIFGVACVLVGLDGSRTATLLAAMTWLVCVTLRWLRYGPSRTFFKRVVVVALWMAVLIGGLNPSPWNPVIHIYSALGEVIPERMLSPEADSDASIVQVGRDMGSDSIRTAMLIEGVRGVQEHFLLGSGFGTTVAQTEGMSVPMVVHMTYLQVLADTGLIGFMGYLGIFVVPLWYFFSALRESDAPWDLFDQNVLPLGIIGIYLFGGLFHPVSNEISEWAIVLPALAMLFKVTERFEGERRL
ncbi:O-antigen ligase family protein [Marinobacter alkaliphilus]|uniref:O-antigen ligase family protein n=1 Tax=Marinobacter alkaliphilus TaxID=254719 RepID=A0ABZ3E0Q5_9GAMM